MRSLTVRLNLVRELAKRDISVEELENILRRNASTENIEKLKIMIADLIQVENQKVRLSGEGKLLLRLISEE
ncbi:MAG: hypothetical protein GXO26_05650 [Crenarchaeota archaeon]|nr:hypothetical protein [Thermoproteota archaeon]